MTEHEIPELLTETDVFADLTPPQLELISGCGRLTALEAGRELFSEGQEASVFYLVRHGRVALELGIPGQGSATLSTHGPGEVLGWSWLFPPYRWHFDGRVVERGSAIVFDAACLRTKAEDDHDLGYELMKRFASQIVERLQATRLQALDVYGHTGPR